MSLITPMIQVGITLLLSLLVVQPAGSEPDLDVLELLPTITRGSDWVWGEEPTEYEPEDLFEYLNGAAPRYVSYGFSSLAHARYAYKGQDLQSVTLDIFDMGSRLGAYGIYSTGRPREISKRSWGTEGYRSGTVAAAWKGRVYLHASADEDTAILIEKLEMLMDHVTEAIPGEFVWPLGLSALPATRLIAGSDRYIGKNLLGHEFLPGGFLANYDVGVGEGLLFLSDLGTPLAAGKAYDLLYTFEENRGKIIRTGKEGDQSFWAEDPGLGLGIVIRRKTYVGGLWGVEDIPLAKGIVAELDEKLFSSILRD